MAPDAFQFFDGVSVRVLLFSSASTRSAPIFSTRQAVLLLVT
jgi:hypothetical protein